MTIETSCYLEEGDDHHFVWEHECEDVARDWASKGHPLDPDTAEFFQEGRNKRQLSCDVVPNGGWLIVQKNPLTLSPSLLCGTCGLHGFFTNGQWRNV